MKKITLIILIFISLTSWAQTYKFHTLQDLGTNVEIAISTECTQNTSSGPTRDFNLRQNSKLEVGKIYKSDLVQGSTSGPRYYKVLYAVDYSLDKGSDIDEPAPFELIPDLCNALSWKYIRPVLLGSNLQEAQNNFCSGQTVNDIRERVNIKTETPLNIGQVYFMDFGKGSNYYLITSSSTEFGDSEYQIDPTNINTIFNPIAFDCQKVDFKAKEISLKDYSDTYRGSKKTITYYLSQIGKNPQTINTGIRFYLTKSRNFVNSNDIIIPTLTNGLTPEQAAHFGSFYTSPSFTIPYTATNGKYYLTMVITNSEDFNPLNNIVSTANTITIIDGTPPTTPTTPPTPPTTPAGKPDLIIDTKNTLALSDCSNCNTTLDELKDRHRVNNLTGELTLPIIGIKNTGTTVSTPTDIQFYASQNTTLETASDPKYSREPLKINAIDPGETYIIQGVSLSAREFGNNGTILNNNWNILMVVDDSKKNTESNENNNVTAIPVTFYDPTIASMTTSVIETTEPYSINVYNFDGQKVLTKEVNSKEEENKSLEPLKTGIYIIKSNTETRKVLKK
jgi:hypothetical protein